MDPRIIYISPKCEIPYEDIASLKYEELRIWAENYPTTDVTLYENASELCIAFNEGDIDDRGFLLCLRDWEGDMY